MKYANNPSNIRYSRVNKWVGQVDNPTQKRFCEFDDLEHGVRALLYLLHKYYYKYHLFSVHEIISRFAPISENDTSAYIRYIRSKLPVCADSESFLCWLVKYICLYESSTSLSIEYVRKINSKYLKQFPK